MVKFLALDDQFLVGRIEGVQDDRVAALDVLFQRALAVRAVDQHAQVAVFQRALAVDKGQSEAARSLGLSEGQTMMKIILPQAVRNILPALGNEFIMMLKETSLASTFFLGDIMTSYLVVKGVSYLTLEPLTIVAIIYLCVTFPLSKIVDKFGKKMASPDAYTNRKRKLLNMKGKA